MDSPTPPSTPPSIPIGQTCMALNKTKNKICGKPAKFSGFDVSGTKIFTCGNHQHFTEGKLSKSPSSFQKAIGYHAGKKELSDKEIADIKEFLKDYIANDEGEYDFVVEKTNTTISFKVFSHISLSYLSHISLLSLLYLSHLSYSLDL
tara:strand:- start:565 stop:1008 length:444 start_codon:yes stop_codon:yes gene_type:complete